MNSHTRTLDVRHTCEELAVVQTLVELEKAKGDNYAMIIIIPLPLPPFAPSHAHPHSGIVFKTMKVVTLRKKMMMICGFVCFHLQSYGPAESNVLLSSKQQHNKSEKLGLCESEQTP